MREEYYEGLLDRRYLTLAQAQARKLNIDFKLAPPVKPARTGNVPVTTSCVRVCAEVAMLSLRMCVRVRADMTVPPLCVCVRVCDLFIRA